jgi:hypothetical protein
MAEEHNEKTFSRQEKESHIKTIEYEIRMLKFCLDCLNKSGAKHQPEEEMWAMLESFLLHYRNLVNFLSGRGRKRNSLTMAQTKRWADKNYDKAETDAIQNLAVPAYKAYSNQISIYLAHCTPERYEIPMEWKPQKMYNNMLPALERFQQLVSGAEVTLVRTALLDDAAYSTATKSSIQMFTPLEKTVFVTARKRN